MAHCNIIGPEFQSFWNAGLRGLDYVDQSAVVCFMDLDDQNTTLTRVFFRSPEEGPDRAEDDLIDWFYEEQLVQKFDMIDVRLYMNYSPLKLTVDGLKKVADNLKAMGKEVKITLKFAELYKTREGEEDAEENCEGLRDLDKYGVTMSVLETRDWMILLQTLSRTTAKKRQAASSAATRKRLSHILKDPRHQGTSIDPFYFQSEAASMTDIRQKAEAAMMTEAGEDGNTGSSEDDNN